MSWPQHAEVPLVQREDARGLDRPPDLLEGSHEEKPGGAELRLGLGDLGLDHGAVAERALKERALYERAQTSEGLKRSKEKTPRQRK